MDPEPPLAGRVALVTGVSRRVGIGPEVVRRLLQDGASVAAAGWVPFDEEMSWGADPGGEPALLDAIQAPPERFHRLTGDLALAATPDRLVADTVDRFGRVDIVVANHARSSPYGFEEVTAEELDLCWAVNARASALLTKSLAARRPPGAGGRVILFTSGQHIGPMDGEIAYAISKGAIHQMTATLANAVVDQGITVNCINPGPVDTGYATGKSHRQIAAMFPGKRWGQPRDVARLIAWLVSDEGEWVTGQILNSEGGFRRWARPRPRVEDGDREA